LNLDKIDKNLDIKDIKDINLKELKKSENAKKLKLKIVNDNKEIEIETKDLDVFLEDGLNIDLNIEKLEKKDN